MPTHRLNGISTDHFVPFADLCTLLRERLIASQVLKAIDIGGLLKQDKKPLGSSCAANIAARTLVSLSETNATATAVSNNCRREQIVLPRPASLVN